MTYANPQLTPAWEKKRREIQQDSRLHQMREALERAEAKADGRGEPWWARLVRGMR